MKCKCCENCKPIESQSLSRLGESSNSRSTTWTERLQSSGSCHDSLDGSTHVLHKEKEKTDHAPIFDI